MMGAVGSSRIPHLTLWRQMMCEMSEGVAVPLFSLQGKILQIQTLASHPDHLCSSSWQRYKTKRRNKPLKLKGLLKTLFKFSRFSLVLYRRYSKLNHANLTFHLVNKYH